MSKQDKNHSIIAKDAFIGYLLLACTVISLIVANTRLGANYLQFWNHPIFGHKISAWINDGLMAVFFLMIGLELKREFLYGELKSVKQATLPLAAAIGGMIVPAVIYIIFNWGQGTLRGFGIPMSTDIAFVIAIIAILGSRVPPALKVFITALAVIDDLGAVLVIAIFYTTNFSIAHLLLALILFTAMALLGQLVKPTTRGVENIVTLTLLASGTVLWFLIIKSGVHASISGILVALTIPSYQGAQDAPLARLERYLHNPVYLIILPLFVLANTAIPFNHLMAEGFTINAFLSQSHIAGIALGLFLGKPLGIIAGVWWALVRGWGKLPDGMNAQHIIGAGFLGGIGFTMAIFITALAFDSSALADSAKIAIIGTSALSAALGYFILKRTELFQQ